MESNNQQNSGSRGKVLVTGAGGYIGSVLIPILLSENYLVVAIDRFFFGINCLPEHKNLIKIKEDCRKIKEQHFHGIDYVIDLVAISNDPSGEAYRNATIEINQNSRINTAKLAKNAGVKRYILPSSCSIYGYQDSDVAVSETAVTNPLTTYALANEQAEKGVLKLKDDGFVVVVLRQATVYGLSKRMRFDLAINGMTYGAWKSRKLPLMRSGNQWRPMVHVNDAAKAQLFMLKAPVEKINGEIFNVGSNKNNYQIGNLGKKIAKLVGDDVEIEWYGDDDNRSYKVSFDKIEELGFFASLIADDGVNEIIIALKNGIIDRDPTTITLEWYKTLTEWHGKIKELEMYKGIIDI
tara:strand:- start:3186 stop:4241 length:1056 start_codon:yes stop_codon:yes gene_type:complete